MLNSEAKVSLILNPITSKPSTWLGECWRIEDQLLQLLDDEAPGEKIGLRTFLKGLWACCRDLMSSRPFFMGLIRHCEKTSKKGPNMFGSPAHRLRFRAYSVGPRVEGLGP